MHHARALRPFAVLAVLVSALAAAVPVAAAAPSAVITVAGGEATSSGEVTLPHRTVVHTDGSVEKIADPKAVAAVRALAAGCGYACDGMDPNSFRWNGSTCASDATNIYSRTLEGRTVELRFSSRCQTAWTRTCCYVRGAGFGYSGDVYRTWVYNPGGAYSGSKTWTAMLYDADSLRYEACLDRVLAGDGHSWFCTARF